MTDAHVLTDPWFIDEEPEVQPVVQHQTLDFEFPSLRPKLAPAMLFIVVVVVAPLVYAAMAMI